MKKKVDVVAEKDGVAVVKREEKIDDVAVVEQERKIDDVAVVKQEEKIDDVAVVKQEEQIDEDVKEEEQIDEETLKTPPSSIAKNNNSKEIEPTPGRLSRLFSTPTE